MPTVRQSNPIPSVTSPWASPGAHRVVSCPRRQPGTSFPYPTLVLTLPLPPAWSNLVGPATGKISPVFGCGEWMRELDGS